MGEYLDKLVPETTALSAIQKVQEYYRTGASGGKVPVKGHLRRGDGPEHRAYVASERARVAEVLKKSLPQLSDEDVQSVVSNIGVED